MTKTTRLSTLLILMLLTGINPAIASEEEGTLETYNRAMFKFNTNVDEYVLKPIAKGYRAVTTEFIRERVKNFFQNLKEPGSIINHSLQGDVSASGVSFGRFAVNSTLGLLGTFDVASGWGLKNNKTNLDTTLAKWCVPDGPYIVLPFFGPSTPRATVGIIGDSVSTPIYWVDSSANFSHDSERYSFYYGLTALGFVSAREENLEFLDKLTDSSVDPYATIKSTYIQNRLKMEVCRQLKESDGKNISYDFDFDEDEDEEE